MNLEAKLVKLWQYTYYTCSCAVALVRARQAPGRSALASPARGAVPAADERPGSP